MKKSRSLTLSALESISGGQSVTRGPGNVVPGSPIGYRPVIEDRSGPFDFFRQTNPASNACISYDFSTNQAYETRLMADGNWSRESRLIEFDPTTTLEHRVPSGANADCLPTLRPVSELETPAPTFAESPLEAPTELAASDYTPTGSEEVA